MRESELWQLRTFAIKNSLISSEYLVSAGSKFVVS